MTAVASNAAGARAPRRRDEETLAAAAAVFARRGYHGATTEEIAAVLGIRQASLYYYFRSKEEALEQVCMRGVAGYVEAAQSIVDTAQTPPEQLAALIRAHLAPLADRADFSRVFIHERQYLPPPSRRKVGRLSRRYEQIIERVIQAGQQDGSLASSVSPRLATLAVLGLCNAALGWYGREPALELDTLTDGFVCIALQGLATRPPRASRRRARAVS